MISRSRADAIFIGEISLIVRRPPNSVLVTIKFSIDSIPEGHAIVGTKWKQRQGECARSPGWDSIFPYQRDAEKSTATQNRIKLVGRVIVVNDVMLFRNVTRYRQRMMHSQREILTDSSRLRVAPRLCSKGPPELRPPPRSAIKTKAEDVYIGEGEDNFGGWVETCSVCRMHMYVTRRLLEIYILCKNCSICCRPLWDETRKGIQKDPYTDAS